MIQNKNLKRRIVEISYKLKLGHIGSCLTAVDIIDEIYRIKKPDEKFVLSAGHAHLAHLVVRESVPRILAVTISQVYNLIEKYGIHCDRQAGCDASTGSLGHGIGIAVGMALADRSKNVYCLLSDGECNEGSVWEAMRIRHELGLTNLKVYLNNNGWAAYKEGGLPRWSDSFEYELRETNMDDYPEWLQGQIAHYKSLSEQEYNELMKILEETSKDEEIQSSVKEWESYEKFVKDVLK